MLEGNAQWLGRGFVSCVYGWFIKEAQLMRGGAVTSGCCAVGDGVNYDDDHDITVMLRNKCRDNAPQTGRQCIASSGMLHFFFKIHFYRV